MKYVIKYGFVLIIALHLLQAGTTGKIVGVVIDKVSRQPLIGANVLVNGTNFGTATDAEGRYFILQIPPKTYSVTFSMIGYKDVVVKDVKIQVDLTTTLNAELEEGVIGMDAVQVTAQRPMVQADVTYSQANITSEEIDMLPVEELEDVVALQAGVVNSGGLHVRGGRSGEIAYLIDGVAVTDPYDAGMAVEIENNAIQELQFISGTFNAEYGKAMSGIINIITKSGDFRKYSGNMSSMLGSYYANDELFPQLDVFRPNTIQDIQGSFNGPIIKDKVSIFASGRYKRNGGYLYGQKIFVPESHQWNSQTNNFEYIAPSHVDWDSLYHPYGINDSSWVAMNWSDQYTGLTKISWIVNPTLRISYSLSGSETASQGYSHAYKWNPYGRSHQFTTKLSNMFVLDYSVSPSTFFTLSLSRSVNHYRSQRSDERDYYNNHSQTLIRDFTFFGFTVSDTCDNCADPNLFYVSPTIDDYTPGNNFEVGGHSMGYFEQKSVINTFKIDGTSQINRFHYLKGGFEYRKTNMMLTSYTVQLAEYTGYTPTIPNPRGSPSHNTYGTRGRNPFEYAFYLQDKIEFEDLVVNVGLRWDYFDPKWKTLNDPSDPNINSPVKPINRFFDLDGDGEISQIEMYPDNQKDDDDRKASNAFGDTWYKNAKPKSQLSPRFALAFPITDQGHMHFSYGHFFAIPQYSYLYTNPEFEVPAGSGTGYTMGNGDLQPQRTTQYEVGFSQQIGADIGIELTGFYKDIKNLNATKIIQSFVAGDKYGLYINQDYANSRGITVALSKRSSAKVSGNFDYTYSVSEGNASDPAAAFNDEASNIEPEKMLVPLDWDQRHTLNTTLTYHPIKNSGMGIIFSFGSGLPYTTQYLGVRTSFENNARKPSTYNIDLRSYYHFQFSGLKMSLSMNVYNLFDFRNELTVFSDTGRSTYSLVPTYTPQYSGPAYNSLNEYLIRPDYYSSPRQIKIGLSVSF